VGHVARILEEKGIATVVIAVEAFKETLVTMSLPRVLITRFPMGRPVGFPGNSSQHQRVIKEALNLLAEATESKTILTFDEMYMSKD
jgi:hypothetical protein